MSDILLIDKTEGMISFDVIRVLRKKLGIKKMGHAGTLDPMATGLLIIGVGEGTKKLKEYLALPKTYIMEIQLGKRTATGDREGKIVEEREVSVDELNEHRVNEVLQGMVGEIELAVPIYSAVKVKGKPLYWYARKGVAVEMPKRNTKIFSLRLLNIDRNKKTLTIKIHCDKGTYVRSVGEEIGRRLGVPTMLIGLRRIGIGNFTVEQAKKLEEL